MNRDTIELELAQCKEARNMNNKGKTPMLDAIKLGSDSCEKDETLSLGDEIDDDVGVQMK
jgi:hypothetical protein